MYRSELERVVKDLKVWTGSPLDQVWQPSREQLVLGLRGMRSGGVVVVPRGRLARLHTSLRRPKNPKQPYSFQGACRARLVGVLESVELHPSDREVRLAFSEGCLVARFTGKSGGLWLEVGGTVVASLGGPAPEVLPALPVRPVRSDSPRFAPEGEETWDEAARRWFGAEEARARVAERRRLVRRGLGRVRARLMRLMEALERDLKSAEEAPLLRRKADALAATLHRVPQGVDSVVVPDLEEEGAMLTVRLDPSRPPRVTLDKLYKRARRLEQSEERVTARWLEAEAKLLEVEQGLEVVDDADGGLLRRLEKLAPPVKPQRRRDDPARPWWVWTGPSPAQVLVGRNAAGNRRLTFQRARGSDTWLHVRGRPGAHVVVRLPAQKTPPLSLLMVAAQIVLLQAKVPEGTAAEVQYTQVRHVRSIPGAADGKVRLEREKVLYVTADRSVLVGWERE